MIHCAATPAINAMAGIVRAVTFAVVFAARQRDRRHIPEASVLC
jgi:hypothetical protein